MREHTRRPAIERMIAAARQAGRRAARSGTLIDHDRVWPQVAGVESNKGTYLEEHHQSEIARTQSK
jgi:hypothetical protein